MLCSPVALPNPRCAYWGPKTSSRTALATAYIKVLKISGETVSPCVTPFSVPNGFPKNLRPSVTPPAHPSTAVVISLSLDWGYTPSGYPWISIYKRIRRIFLHPGKPEKAFHGPAPRSSGPVLSPWSPFLPPSPVWNRELFDLWTNTIQMQHKLKNIISSISCNNTWFIGMWEGKM